MSERWIDIHTHLDMLELTPEQALNEAAARGVDRVITIGTQPSDLTFVQEMVARHPGKVYGALGLHPHEAKFFNDDVRKTIEEGVQQPGIVAIGEIGLDYYYEHSDRAAQKIAFESLLDLSVQTDMPVEIHTRDAEDDTIAILENFGGRVRGIFHCFTGTQKLANAGLRLGLNLSISGIVTFKTAEDLRQVVRNTPVDRLHVETDAPFLAPVPHRGKKNLPGFVVETGHFVAGLKGMDVGVFARQMIGNAERVFTRLRG